MWYAGVIDMESHTTKFQYFNAHFAKTLTVLDYLMVHSSPSAWASGSLSCAQHQLARDRGIFPAESQTMRDATEPQALCRHGQPAGLHPVQACTCPCACLTGDTVCSSWSVIMCTLMAPDMAKPFCQMVDVQRQSAQETVNREDSRLVKRHLNKKTAAV